ncbi:glycosyltransferase family 4 protein [Brevundimonas intermedia]|uniref:glycosyltransferase family 4 protein n=1 Tax=Brevundimonas intermedia TaxID=74315 RepID=UPI0032081E24
MTTICFDGYNLALPSGTGIATYGRTLIDAVRGMGVSSQLLHGPNMRPSKDPFLAQLALADARQISKPPRSVRHLEVAAAWAGRTARYVEATDEIFWPTRDGRPEVDAFWIAPDLFRIAVKAHAKYRAITPLSFSPSRSAPDIMHWSMPTPLRARGVPNVYTFHDLIPLRLPHTTSEDKTRYLQMCRDLVRRADHIITVSETTRNDVINLLGVSPDRVTNTFQAVQPTDISNRSNEDVAETIWNAFGLKWKDYFIHFGAVEPKKNLGRVVEGYVRAGVCSPLVIVEGRSWLEQPEVALLEALEAYPEASMTKRIHRLRYLPRAMLQDLIRGARATVFPSLYEGFGLPVLESMGLGTAVLTSKVGGAAEVAGHAALLVDPYRADEIGEGMRRLEQDHAFRRHLEDIGRLQAGKFGMDHYRERLNAVYGGVA